MDNLESIYQTAFGAVESTAQTLVCTLPDGEYAASAIDALYAQHPDVRVTLIASQTARRAISTGFVTGSFCAELLAKNKITVYEASEPIQTAFVAGGQTMYTVGAAPASDVGTLSKVTEETRKAVQGDIDAMIESFDDDDQITLQYSPYSETIGQLQDHFGVEVAADFETVVHTEAFRQSDDLVETEALLIVAGQHALQPYEVGKWAEFYDFTSQATVNRRKSYLVEAGVLETSKERDPSTGRDRQTVAHRDFLEDEPLETVVTLTAKASRTDTALTDETAASMLENPA